MLKKFKPGVTTLHLDKLAEEFIRDHGAVPGFLGLYGCPSTLLTSVNDQVVHGLPTNRPIEEGDIVSVDCGTLMNEYYGDHAYTFEIGEVAPETKKFLQITKESLYVGIREFKAGNRVEDVGNAIQKYTEAHGYGVVRELVGHGFGQKNARRSRNAKLWKTRPRQNVCGRNGCGDRANDQFGFEKHQTIERWLDNCNR